MSLAKEQVAAPVAALMSMGVEVYVKKTRTVPHVLMPYTNPKQDVDVSGQMETNGHIELGLTQVCHFDEQMLQSAARCQRAAP